MEELKSMLHQLIDDTKKLTKETHDLRAANEEIRRVARRSRSTARVLACVVVFVVAVGAASWIQLNGVSNCINDNLGKRSAPSKADARAHIDFAEAIKAAFDTPVTATLAQRKAAGLRLRNEINSYVVTLVADQATRDRTPLGTC